MRFIKYSLACLGLLVACHPADAPTDASAPSLPAGGLVALRGTWLLVPEASRADTLAYRRNTYRFRYRPGGRPGFRMGPAGRFTRFDLAPGGGLLAQQGTWTEDGGPDRLRIHLPELRPAAPDYNLVLLGYRGGMLLLSRRR